MGCRDHLNVFMAEIVATFQSDSKIGNVYSVQAKILYYGVLYTPSNILQQAQDFMTH